MTEFQGIPIDEGILHNTLVYYSVLIVIVCIAFLGVILFAKHLNKKTSEEVEEEEKRERHIRHLEKILHKKPHLRDVLEKQLAAQKEQQEEDVKQKKGNRVIDKVIYAVAVGSIALVFFVTWLPCYRDTVNKSYIAYTGVFTLEYTRSSGWLIILPDGTALDMPKSTLAEITLKPDEDTTYTGTIVYATRSQLVLGIEWETP